MMQRTGKYARMWVLLLVAGVLGGFGCGNQNQRTANTSMFKSDGEFARGRNDGKRDSKWSMMDASAAWLWLWMAKEEYGQGYRQGWTEGRTEVKFKQEEERAKKDTKRDESDPNTRDSEM